MRVLVAHPGLQHAHELAKALHGAGALEQFWSGVPLTEFTGSSRAANARVPRWPTPIPGQYRRHFPVFPALRRLALNGLPATLSNVACHQLDHAFDRWTSHRIGRTTADMVVCYENAALKTFEAAKRRGMICVLDAASIHHRAASGAFGAGLAANPQWVNRQKDQEIALADAVLTCSPFAAATYLANGVPEHKIYPCHLGTDLSAEQRLRPVRGLSSRFLFVGNLLPLKGVDILLDVFDALHRDGVSAHLSLVGGGGDAALMARARSMPNVGVQSFVRKPALFDLMAQHDYLVLPSRFDSFGMVVPEAMSVGVPVIVSDRVGAKMIIEQHPSAGWIVPLEREALQARIRTLIDNPGWLKPASAAALVAAQDYSWPAYRSRVVEVLHGIHKAAA